MRVKSGVFEGERSLSASQARIAAVNEAIRDDLSAYLDEQRKKRRAAVGVGALALVAGVGVLAAGAGVAAGAGLALLGVAVGGGGYAYLDRQEPDVTVTGLREETWTGYCIPDERGVLAYDANGGIQGRTFELERIDDASSLRDSRERLESIREFPVVMPRGRNVEAEVLDTLSTVEAELDDVERRTVEANAVQANSRPGQAVQRFARAAEDADPVDVETEVDLDTAKEEVSSLSELEELAAEEGEQAELDRLSSAGREVLDDLSNHRSEAIELLNEHVNTAGDAFGLVSYRFYCPDCLRDDIESQLEFVDPAEGRWRCDTCRSEVETEEAIPRHRIRDEVVNPVWDQLWIEKDDQRREIYENIEDQKHDLEEREFEQSREEIRSMTDRMRELRSRVRDLKTEAKAAEGKVEEIGDLMVQYERLHKERKEQFQANVQESFAEIDEETEEILEETRNVEEERIEEAQEAAKEKAQLMREEERKREREKLLAQQQMMQEQTEAIMQQQAELTKMEMGHQEALTKQEMGHEQHLAQKEAKLEQKHHDEQYLAETGSSVTISSTINRGKSAFKKLTPGN